MSIYVCLKCSKEVDVNVKGEKVMCTYCSERILLKKRPDIAKKVDAV
jgi:DNA-directed RNA polymerase subunit RPC12/RpoP